MIFKKYKLRIESELGSLRGCYVRLRLEKGGGRGEWITQRWCYSSLFFNSVIVIDDLPLGQISQRACFRQTLFIYLPLI